MEDLSKLYRIDKNGCWRFKLYVNCFGYGKINRDGKTQTAHRYFYEKLIKKIPAGLTLDHLCKVRDCVNPFHLEPVTLVVNVMRGNGYGAKNSRKKLCPYGHAYIQCTGQRRCKPCSWKSSRKHYKKMMADDKRRKKRQKQWHLRYIKSLEKLKNE